MNKTTIHTNRFYTAADVASLLGVSSSTAYRIIKQLNNELKQDGYIVIPGKIGRTYFERKIMM